MLTKFALFESAPRLPKSEEYWKKRGKYGKDVCLIFHDDMDGVVSAIIMKNFLDKKGFKIKKYGIINYQEGWSAFRIDSRLITIALDFAEDIPGVDYYVDHHGKFTEEIRATQKRPSIKTATGSAAEGIAQQLGVPFSNDTKDWIDMIDSAKYSEYDVDIRGILNFDLKEIVKSGKNAKLNFAAAMNQLLKRSDHKTFIEVVNACNQPSIYKIYNLFKSFYPRNNPDFKSGDEPEFVSSARIRLKQMEKRTRGGGSESEGFDAGGKKIIFKSQTDFWNAFANNLPYQDFDEEGKPLSEETDKWQLKPGVYQIIGNLMYVPSGTWANALRAKAIFAQDVENGIIPDDVKLNFVLLQYGNTLQLADLKTKMEKMKDEDLPKDRSGNPIKNLGKYMEGLVKNFEDHLDYKDERTASGGHYGIGSISNIFGKCKKSPYEGVRFLDMFKNKIINDISGVKWGLTMPWNEVEERKITVKPEEVNKKLVDISDVRSESEVHTEREERELLNYIIHNGIGDFKSRQKMMKMFKNETMRNIYEIWLETNFMEIESGSIKASDLPPLYFKKNKNIEDSELFNKIVDKFGFDEIYNKEATDARGKQRKELKRIFKIIFNMMAETPSYIKKDTEGKFRAFNKD